jgi:hypothetical protein
MTRSIFLLILISIFLSGCGFKGIDSLGVDDEDIGEKYIYVDHYKQNDCYRVTESIDGWESYCGIINFFDYEWGYEYELKVLGFKAVLPFAAGGEFLEYNLIETISKHKVPEGTGFDYHIVGKNITKVPEGTGTYLVSQAFKFTCEVDDCLYIESQNNEGIGMTIEFIHPETSSSPFIFNQIKCSAPISSFDEACNSF